MKSKRRHELKENVLAHELVQVKEFASRYGTWILMVAAIAAVGYLGYKKYNASRLNAYAQEKSQYSELAFSRDRKLDERAKGLTDLFQTAKNPAIRAAAGLAAGETWVQMYMDGLISAAGLSPEQAKQYSQNAQDAFQKVLDTYSSSDQFRVAAGAEQGLAVLYDNMANTAIEAGDKTAATDYADKAEHHYREVTRLLGPNDPASFTARNRIEALKNLQPIRFATTMPAAAEASPAEDLATSTAPAPEPEKAPAPAPAPTTATAPAPAAAPTTAPK